MPPVVLVTLHALNDFVGREIALTEWLTISQDRIDRLAEATQDRQWIHVIANARIEKPPTAQRLHTVS